ncbi:MAG: efflux RND transporter periplasmic adaptor subunit [Acidobacteria bacterium]|nr:efflux RND transporter periplasmic adaptor subunit [Acidobacteriota bacterium]
MEERSNRRKIVFILLLIGVPLVSLFAFRFYQSSADQSSPAGRFAGQRPGPNRQPGGAEGRPQRGGNRGPGARQGRPQLVEVATIDRGTIRERVSLVGSLKPKQQVEVIPKITGRLERIFVDVGDPVREGQLIAELEGEELAQQVLRADAALAVAEATLAQREAELENARAEELRAADLFAQGLLSVQGQQTSETRARVVQSQLALAEAQVRQAEAALEELRIRQQQTQIRSPLDGWVARRYVHPGALVNPNTPMVTVLQLSTMVTQVSVPERDFAKLRVGNQATVVVDALDGRSYEGHVARISPLLDPTTRSGSVEIEIPNSDGQLKAEMFARIQMDLGTDRQVLLVPRDAVILRGQQTGVNVLLSDRVQFRPIETGASTEQGIEVLAGVDAGTTVITRGSQGLKDGDLVVVPGGQSALPTPEDRS